MNLDKKKVLASQSIHKVHQTNNGLGLLVARIIIDCLNLLLSSVSDPGPFVRIRISKN